MTQASLGAAAPTKRGELALCEEAQKLDRRNQKFANLPPDKRRVALAQDVLKWLDSKKLVASRGDYLGIVERTTPPDDAPSQADGRNRVDHDLDHVNGHRCVACALGSIFAVGVERRLPGLDLTGIWTGWGGRSQGSIIRSELRGYFSLEQLILIETAFERSASVFPEEEVYNSPEWKSLGGIGRGDDGVLRFRQYESGSAIEKAIWFGRNAGRADDDVLRAIMNNIIKNRGTFRPEV